jgi:hypothetical protein
MSTPPTAAISSSSGVNSARLFWERFWRSSGIQALVLFIVAYLIYGTQPQVGTPADTLVAFYTGDRTRILIASVLFGVALLNLLWFAAALRTTLAEAGQEGWGAAATAASAVLGGLFLLIIAVEATLAYAIAGSGNNAFLLGLNNFAWVCLVLTSFPRAMLVMSAAFGLWRAGLISNSLFAIGVAAVVLVLLGGTTWMGAGFWAVDGAYSRFISPLVGIIWLVVVSGVLLSRSPPSRAGW